MPGLAVGNFDGSKIDLPSKMKVIHVGRPITLLKTPRSSATV